MTRQDKARADAILALVDELMNKPSKENATITNADVVEAMYGDILCLIGNRDPKHLLKLAEQDQ